MVDACKTAVEGYEDTGGFQAGGETVGTVEVQVLASDSPLPPVVCG